MFLIENGNVAFELSTILCLLVPSVFSSINTVRYKHDECLSKSADSNSPNCLVHSLGTPKLRCDPNSPDEVFMAEDDLKNKRGGVIFECSAPYLLEFDFDGSMPLGNVIAVPEWRNETGEAEYVLNVGLKNYPAAVVGKYTFFALGNRSLSRSIYLYCEDNENDQLLMNSPSSDLVEAHKLNNSSDVYVLPCRPLSKFTTVTLTKENKRIDELPCVKFNPKSGFVINATDLKCSSLVDPWEGFKCRATSTKFSQSVPVKLNNNERDDFLQSEESKLRIFYIRSERTAYCRLKTDIADSGGLLDMINVYSTNPLESRFKKYCLGKHGQKSESCEKLEGEVTVCPIENGTSTPGNSGKCASVKNVYKFGLLLCRYNDHVLLKEYFIGFDGQFYDYNRASDIPGSVRIKVSIVNTDTDGDIYQNKSYKFTCKSVIYGGGTPLFWYIQENNQKFIFYETVRNDRFEELMEYFQTEEEFFITKNLTGIMCSSRLWDNSNTWFNQTYQISSKVAHLPSFQKSTEILTFYIGDDRKSLACNAEGPPAPHLQWFKNGKRIAEDVSISVSPSEKPGLSYLRFSVVNTSHEGNYTCRATNDVGTSEKSFTLLVKKRPSTDYGTIVGVTFAVIVVVSGIVVLVAFMYNKHTKMYLLSSKEIDDFRNGNPGAVLNENSYAVRPYCSDEYEIDKSDLITDESALLGSGQFGVVYKGTYKNVGVAVKTIKEDFDKLYIISMLSEIKVMIHIGQHENIVHFVGAITKEARKGKVFLVLELYCCGSLENRLRKSTLFTHLNETELNLSLTRDYENYSKDKVIMHTDALRWSLEMAKGMEYLRGKNVIHGDLATRNILLNEKLQVKISDFGLSRKLYEYGVYQKESKEPLPWRWMSIESLRFNTFSSRSDVWSYGVTLWEIFSKGDVPYPGIIWNVNFVTQLLDGLRLNKPQFADQEMYDLMFACWHEHPQERISFSVMIDRISTKLGMKTPEQSLYEKGCPFDD